MSTLANYKQSANTRWSWITRKPPDAPVASIEVGCTIPVQFHALSDGVRVNLLGIGQTSNKDMSSYAILSNS
jgi:hypothetical protein